MASFPDVLVPKVLDYLELDELLFCAMPVNRFWRWSAIEHPCYWRYISLDEESMHERRVYSADLFFLRLARAGAKPVDLRVWMKDPTTVLDTLTRELSHIRRLTMCIGISHSHSLFQCMRDTPAPILESLNMIFADEPECEVTITIPAVLFGFEAPVLTNVSITNCALPSEGELPNWLSNITSFIYHIARSPRFMQQLPNIFASWPRLRDLRLSGPIGLYNPAFLQASTWSRLEFLSLGGALVEHLDTLPLSHVPRIRITEILLFSADHMVLIANSLMNPGGLLDVTLRAHSDNGVVPTITLYIVIKSLSDAGKWRGRWTQGNLPRDAPGLYPDDFVTALQHAPLLARIASLSVSLDSWDMLVGRGFLAQFPGVEDLVLTLEHWFFAWKEVWRAPARTAKLALPRLRHVTFRFDRFEHYAPAYRTPVLQLADLAEFATHQLSGARLPLRLSLAGVKLNGVPEDFTDLFQM